MRNGCKAAAYAVVLLAVCVLPLGDANAGPTYRFGVKGGLEMGKLTGDDTKGAIDLGGDIGASISGDVDRYRTGFIGGIYFLARFTDLFGMRLEALYAMKGGKGDVSGTIDISGYGVVPFNMETTFKLDYIEIPILAVLSVPVHESVRLEVEAGVALSFNVGADLTLDGRLIGYSYEHTENIDEYVTGSDAAGVLGGVVVFDAGRVDLFVDGRWTFGFSSIDDTGADADIKNSALSFMVGVGIPLGAGE